MTKEELELKEKELKTREENLNKKEQEKELKIVNELKATFEKEKQAIENKHKEEIKKIKEEEENRRINEIKSLLSGRDIEIGKEETPKEKTYEESVIDAVREKLKLKGEK